MDSTLERGGVGGGEGKGAHLREKEVLPKKNVVVPVMEMRDSTCTNK